jgi:hypothetical protein
VIERQVELTRGVGDPYRERRGAGATPAGVPLLAYTAPPDDAKGTLEAPMERAGSSRQGSETIRLAPKTGSGHRVRTSSCAAWATAPVAAPAEDLDHPGRADVGVEESPRPTRGWRILHVEMSSITITSPPYLGTCCSLEEFDRPLM